MSQVITKLQKGGSLTIDGIKYDATPEFINALTTHLRDTAGTDAQTLAGLSNALQNGQDLRYDSAANTISGMDGVWSGITEKQNERRRAGSSNWRKWWEAQFDTDAHRFRNALSAIGSFHYQVPKAVEEIPDLANIYGDQTWYEYNTDENGNKTWLDNSSKNIGIAKRLADMTDYLSDVEAGKKKYKLGDWYSPERIDALKGLYGQYSPDTWNSAIAAIGERAKNNSLTPEDIAFLKNFNIVDPGNATENTTTAELATNKKRYTDAGFDYDKWSPYISWNNQGNYWGVTPEGMEAFKSAFGGNGNYWFNDLFINSQYNPNGAYDFLNGYFILGDRLYKQSDAENPTSQLSQILRRKGGFRDLNAGMRHNEANDLIEQLWGNEMGWEAPTAEYYSDWLDPNGNIYYRSRTGDYNWTGKTNDQQLIEWIEANPELADAFGYYTPKFKITDKNGNNSSDITEGLTPLSLSQQYESPFNRYKLWYSENGNSDFDGRYFLGDGYDEEGNVTGAGFWINPNNPNEDWIFESDEMHRFVPDLEGNAVRVPKEMVAILANNPDFIKKFQKDESGFRSKFAKVMAGAVGRGINFSTFMANAGPQAWMNLGFDRDTARKLAQMSRNYSQNQRVPLGAFLTPIKSNRGKRRAERMVNKPTLHKDGGKVKKAAYGDMVGKSSGNTASQTQIKTEKPIRDTGNFTNFGEGKLQPHDWIELGAIAADAASIGFAFAPEIWTNVAAGATGMAGSTAGFIADIKRDGFQGSDLGQYGINLGLDALSFIPILGGFSKSEKVARSLQKSAKVIDRLMKAAALYGIPHAAVQSWDAIKNGKFNMRDLRAVVNVIGGVTHMSRSGFRKPVRGEAIVEYPTINLKAGKKGNPIKLTESQFNAIQKANPKTKDELAEQIGKLVNETKEQVIDKYDLNSFIDHKDHRFGLFGKEVNKVKLTADKKKGEIQWQDMSKNPERVQNHETYLANLAGRQPMSRVTNTIETITEPGIPTLAWRPKYKTIGSTIPARTEKYVMPDGTVKEVRYPGISNRKRVVVNEADKALPVPVPMVKKQVTKTSVEDITPRLITPVTSGVIWERQADPLKSPVGAIGPNRINYSRGYMWQPVSQPVFRKKGGKIEKGQTGLKLNLDILDPNKVKSQGFIPKIDPMYKAPSGSIPTFVPNQPKELSPELQNFKVVNPMTKQAAVDTRTKQSELIQNPEDDLQGTFSAKKWDPDLNVPLNWARSLYAMKQSDKQLKNFLNRPQYQASDLLLNAPRYINTGTGNAYRNEANKLRLFKPVTSDAMQNDLMARDRQREALNAELQGNLADSQEYGQYKAGLDDFNRDYTQKKYNIAEQNKQLRWQHEIENVQAKNANIAEKSKFFDQAAYATQDWYNRNYQTRQQIEGLRGYNSELARINEQYAQKMNDWRARHADDPNGEAATQELATIKTWLALQQQGLGESSLIASLSPGFKRGLNKQYVKKGGKVNSGKQSAVTYSRDPYPELLLQNAKDSTEIVKQLNDAVIKLLLQTKPINVH